MTTIEFNDPAQGVLISGHSGYAEAGRDIVCASVSALAWALIGALTKRDALNYVHQDDGEILICYRELPGVETYLDMFQTGVELIEYKYPDNVRVQGRKSVFEDDNMNGKGGGA